MKFLNKFRSKTLISLTLASSLAIISISCSKNNKRKKKRKSKPDQTQENRTPKPASAFNPKKKMKYAITQQTKIKGNKRETTFTNNIDNSQIVVTDQKLSQNSHTYEYLLKSPTCLNKAIHLKNLSKNNLCSNLKNDKLHNNCAKNNRDFVFKKLCRRSSYANHAWSCNSLVKEKKKNNKFKNLVKPVKDKKIEVNILSDKRMKLTKSFALGKRKGKLFKRKNKYDNFFYFDKVKSKAGFKLAPKSVKNPIEILALASNEEVSFNYRNEQIDLKIKCNTVHAEQRVPCSGYFKSGGNQDFNINYESYFKPESQKNGLSKSSDIYNFDFEYEAVEDEVNGMKYLMTIENIHQDTPEVRFSKDLNKIELEFENEDYILQNTCRMLK